MGDADAGRDPEEWVDYQQTEIDNAREAITDRRDALGDHRQRGLLDGDFVNHRDNSDFKRYLQGYADALEFAADVVDGIDNLVKYVAEDYGRGEEYLDDREPVAYIYNGEGLVAVTFKEPVTEMFRVETPHTVAETPKDGDVE